MPLFSAPAPRPTYRIEQKTHLLARHGKQIAWRWQSQKPLHLLGVSLGNLIVWERLRALPTDNGGNTDRYTALEAATGRRKWQRVIENVSAVPGTLDRRLLWLYQPNGTYAVGTTVLLDVRTGKTVLTTGFTDNPIKQTQDQILWMSLPGAPFGGGELAFTRLNLHTLQTQSLVLRMPPEFEYDETPIYGQDHVRFQGDIIEALYSGYRNHYKESVAFIARYRWSRGSKQKPEIQILKDYNWPK